MSSLVGWQGTPRAAHYAATKAYIQALAEAIHVELKPSGVDVLASAPGPVHSGFASQADMRMGAAAAPADVAKASLAALGRRTTVVPGLLSKLLTYSLATLPRTVRTRVMGRVMYGMTRHQNVQTPSLEQQSRLARSLRKLDQQTDHLMAELQGWSPARLSLRPFVGAWSALDLLEHLRLTEGAVVATMRRNLPARNRVTIRDRFRSARILGIMLLPIRLQVPGQVKAILPLGTQKNLPTLRQHWTDERKALDGFLESLFGIDQEQGVFRHPFGGWTTPSGALLFLRWHLRHHRYQLARLRKASVGRSTPPIMGASSARSGVGGNERG